MPEIETKDMSMYEMGSWLSQNLQYMVNIERDLKIMSTRLDSLPRGFNPSGILVFIQGAVQEVKRVTSINQALTQALKEQALRASGTPSPEDKPSVEEKVLPEDQPSVEEK